MILSGRAQLFMLERRGGGQGIVTLSMFVATILTRTVSGSPNRHMLRRLAHSLASALPVFTERIKNECYPPIVATETK